MENNTNNNFIDKLKSRFFGNKNSGQYLTRQESKDIANANRETVKRLERYKKRKNADPSEYITDMKNPDNIIEFDDLRTYFFTDSGVVKSVDGVSFNIPKNSIVGVVGESGCGKSVTALSLMQLVQAPQGQIVGGSIRFNTKDYELNEKGEYIPLYEEGKFVTVMEKGAEVQKPVQKMDADGLPLYKMKDCVYDIAKMPLQEMYKVRGREIAMIFQEPMTSLNPVITIGKQLDEVTLLHIPGSKKEAAKKRSVEMLQSVGIAMPDRVYKQFPHELSGGMRQRVMIAMALACNPKLIIADEPTTALDVTIQAQILDLLRNIKETTDSSIMLITHDLGVIAEMADLVVVMYAGRIIEMGTAMEIFNEPKHPYTIGLQKSKPVVNKIVDRLYSISGQVPSPVNMPSHCYFKGRCEKCVAKCSNEYPGLFKLSDTHFVSCYLYEDENIGGENNESI